jgi:hypothetical protein
MSATPSTDETTTAKYEVALKGDTKTPMLLNVEGGVKEVISALAKKGVIKGAEDISPEAYAHYPNSITGVCMHLMVTGLKAELDIAFDETPKSIRQRGSAMDKKVAGKKRLLTREQKNELLEQAQMSFYETKIATGTITIEDAMNSIREAFTKKQEFEKMGYMLPAGKTKYPYWVEEGDNE